MSRENHNIQNKQPAVPTGRPVRQAASISVDLDNLWSYLKTQGEASWAAFPGYLDKITPRIRSCFDRLSLRATFFIVGRDASMPQNREVLRAIADAGHEIANHTFEHEPWLHLYTRQQLEADFERSEEAIHSATGHRPAGFRGPGFSSSPEVLATLVRRGYAYDASVFPTPLGPLARLAFNLGSKLPPEEKAKRSGLYGPLSNAVRPLRPFHITPDLVEVPVTTMPVLRAPIHLSYLLFLAQRSDALARLYWSAAATMCRAFGVGPSLLLHPTDFFDGSEVPEMRFFPGMKIPAARKQSLVEHAIQTIQRHWRAGTVADHASTRRATAPASPVTRPSAAAA